MEKEQLTALSENGAKEVKEIEVKHKGQVFKAIFTMSFLDYQKIHTTLMSVSASGSQGVQADLNIVGAGDKALFLCWHSGDEIIRKNFKLRKKACAILGEWILDLIAEDEEEIEEKKS